MEQGEQAQYIEHWAERIERAGMVSITTALLEAARPLGFLASQVLLLGEPLLSGFTASSPVRRVAEMIEDPDQVDLLLQRLSKGERL
ncbi:MAG: hypothetical protein JXD18_05155 [Anaerolineae bacterium]|nr:hypothetical protein [Anaerolineae bacterium]